MARALMFQGTGSDVGKSLLVAGLCRAYTKRGLKVLPFKPQNMSNNAAVTADGGEIGRAQALQARACGIPLHTDMNPVLLKPQSEIGSQVVVQGKVWGNAKAREYQNLKPELLAYVHASFDRLKAQADLVLVEGAGSPAEVNLRAGDIANMGFATSTNTPVVLIGDIDRGGVIAQIVGTHAVIQPTEQDLIKGFVINKFRGDVSLFDDGLKIIEQHTSWPSYGVATYFWDAAKLPPEDAVAISAIAEEGSKSGDQKLKIVVPVLPRIANFDDLDPLRTEPDVQVQLVQMGAPLPMDADLILMPGSKATIADLECFYETGWDIDLKAHVRRGGSVLGICGGYQMLGNYISDPKGIEGTREQIKGLGLLKVETELAGSKLLTEVSGHDLADQNRVKGYHMHIGVTEGPDANERPLFMFGNQSEGAVSEDGRVMGAYIHGMFAEDAFRHAFLNRLKSREASNLAYEKQVENTLDALADHLEACLDLDGLLSIAA